MRCFNAMLNNLFSDCGCENVQIVLSASDLKTVFRNVLSEFLAEQQEKKEDQLVPRSAANDRLHVDDSTLWRWDKSGYLKAIRIGRAVYYKESDIKRLEEGRV